MANHSIYRVPGYVADDKVEEVQKRIAEAVEKTQTEDAGKHPSYSSPHTPDEWWALAEEWWPELLSILEQFVRLDKPVEDGGQFLGMTGYVHVAQLKQARDRKLAGYFDAAWWNAPDNGMIHAIPGWGVLCDLCSEQWVFDEGEEGEEAAR